MRDRLTRITEHGGLRLQEVAQLLGTTPETVSRWNAGRTRPKPHHFERLLKLEWIVTQLSRLYAPYWSRLWFFSTQPHLDGTRPFDRICSGGLDEVEALVRHSLVAPHREKEPDPGPEPEGDHNPQPEQDL